MTLPSESWTERARWDLDRQLKAAKSWAGNVDVLAKQGKLGHAMCAITDGCAVMVLRGPKSDWWLVKRAVETLAENGHPVRREFNSHWLARLESASESEVSHMGEPIEIPYEAPKDWRDV